MALVKTMGTGPMLLALAPLLAILFSAARVHSCRNFRPATPQASTDESSGGSSSSSRYRIYIVLLERPKDADVMDKDAHRRWHQSFLPSTLTESGEPRLRSNYNSLLHGFSAWLTDAELEAVAKKPGFVSAFPNRVHKLDDNPTREYYFRSERRAGNVERAAAGAPPPVPVGLDRGRQALDRSRIETASLQQAVRVSGFSRCDW